MDYQVKTAVGVVIFNRKEKAQALYEALKKVKPSKLYVIADGPRNEDERVKCEETRSVFENVEWNCEIHRNYAEHNLGCCVRPQSGFTWVLENEPEAIFLEDDCIPCVDFFKYCDEMLEKYRDDERIMQVSGTNYLKEWHSGEYSYHFARWGSIWGWATWARAWKNYDVEIKSWKDENTRRMIKQQLGELVYKSRAPIYDKICCNTANISAWDHQWSYTRLVNNGLSIVPCRNLVMNIGSGEDATHTSAMGNTSIPALGIYFPIKHPEYVMRDIEFDRKIEIMIFDAIPRWKKAIRKGIRIIKKCFGR